MSRKIEDIEKEINQLKKTIIKVGNMRPGKLSTQYRNPKDKKIPYNQISYTFSGKSYSEYVRPENIDSIKAELEEYRKFKSIIEDIIALSLEASKLRGQLNRK